MKKVVVLKPRSNEKQIKHVMSIVFKGHCTIYDFVENKDVCLILADIDEGIIEELKDLGYTLADAPELEKDG